MKKAKIQRILTCIAQAKITAILEFAIAAHILAAERVCPKIFAIFIIVTKMSIPFCFRH